MPSKIRVYGKAQNRTCLGIAHAYAVMYPQATLQDFRKAFPNSICPDKGVAENFLPKEDALAFNKNMSLYFAKDDEVITLADGSQIALSQVWTKPSFDRMVEQGKLYDIEVAEFEKTSRPGQKGGFRLEYLNGYVPPVAAVASEKKRSRGWIWILLLLLLAAAAVIYFLTRPEEKPQVVEKIVEKEVVVRDTVFVEQVAEIEKNFNAAQFELGKADLNDDAKLALHDLAKVMKQDTVMRLRITGHTSSEGSEEANLRLSRARAQAAVDFLVNREGIRAERLEAVGMGSSQPVNPDSLELNRRTEFQILE